MRIGRGSEFSRTRTVAGSGIDKLDKELARAPQSPGRQEQDSGDDNRDESHEGDGGDDEDLQRVFFSKAAKEGDPAGVRDQLLPIQSFMRKHALGPEQLEDDVREAHLDALCMK